MKHWPRWLLAWISMLPVCAYPASTNSIVTRSSLSLDQSIDYALRHNVQVLKAREEIRRNYGVVVETRGQLMPQVRLSSSLVKREQQTLEFFGNEQAFDGVARVTQVLYSGGQIWGSVRSSYLNRDAAILSFESTVADTILSVQSTFDQVLFNVQLIKVREASVHLLEEQLETTKRRFEAGTVPKFDVLRAEVELANARPPLIQAQNDLRIARIRLANLLAIDTDHASSEAFPYVLVGDLQYVPYNDDVTRSLKIAMDKRSELKELQKRLESRKATLQATYSGYKPRLDLFGQYEARSATIGETKTIVSGSFTNAAQGTTDDLDPTVRGFSAGIEMSWDIFDGFSTRGRVMQARALYDAARLDLEDKRREIEFEVRQSQSSLQEARETLESQKKVVEQGEESLRLAQARFSVGAGTQLDVLSAQTALTDARTTYAKALYDYNIALATLERATGVSTRLADLEGLRKKH